MIMLASGLLIVVAVYTLLSKTQRALEDQIGKEALLLTEQIITEIDGEIYHRIEEMQAYAIDISLVDELRVSNEQFDRIDDLQGFIDTIDNDWKSGKATPFISGILNNELSQKLNKHLEFYEQKYGYAVFGEIFVTNKYGAAIAASTRLSDYLQADEPWYLKATAEKEVWVDDLEYDDSSGTFSVGIVVKLYDEKGSFAGLVNAALNVEDIRHAIELVQSRSSYKSMKPYLVDRNGLSIFSGLDPLLKQKGKDIRLAKFGTDVSYRASVSEALRGNDGYMLYTEDGKKLLSVFSHSKGFRNFKGLGWSIIIDFDTDEVFGPIATLKSNLAIIIVITMTAFTLIVVFIFRSISKPIIKLRDASIKISKGELDTKVDFKSKDEIGQLAGAFNEMTRKLSERDIELRKSEEKFSKSFSSSPNTLVIVDLTTLKRIEVNETFLRITGYGREELLNSPVDSLTINKERFEQGFQTLVNEGSLRDFELGIRTKSGRERTMLYSGETIEMRGGRYAIVAGQDITESKQAEEEREKLLKTVEASNLQLLASDQQLRASNQQLSASEQQLQASNQQLSANEQQLRASNQQTNALNQQLIANQRELGLKNEELQSIVYISSHDLKTPLVNINGFSALLIEHCEKMKELLNKCDIDAETKKEITVLLNDDIPTDLDYISTSTQRMERLIEGLLQVSRIGTVKIEVQKINMKDLVAEIINNVKYKMEELGAEITFEDLPDCTGDKNQITQVFMNLIDNSLKYLSGDRKGWITITGKTKDKESIYRVKDNGIGINPAYQGKIFEIYHRLNPQTATEGDGLGLTIVQRVLDRHKGRIWVESEEGKGSKFFVALPNVS